MSVQYKQTKEFCSKKCILNYEKDKGKMGILVPHDMSHRWISPEIKRILCTRFNDETVINMRMCKRHTIHISISREGK